MRANRLLWVLLLACALVLTLACRLGNLIAQNTSKRPPVVVAANSKARTATPTRTRTPERRASAAPRVITVVVTATPTEFPADFEFPTAAPNFETPTDGMDSTEFPFPTDSEVLPASVPVITNTPRPSSTASRTPTATPTREFPYTVASSDCRPDVRTYIEGYVYEQGVQKGGIIVRISMSPGGDPAPNDDYVTGKDPKGAGYYFHNIDVNRPHGGLWYIFLLDPDTKRRVSDVATVKTDSIRVEDDDNFPGSCQKARVDFNTAGYGIQPTPTNTLTPTVTGTPTRTGTPPTSTPTSTPTLTPTPTSSITVTP